MRGDVDSGHRDSDRWRERGGQILEICFECSTDSISNILKVEYEEWEKLKWSSAYSIHRIPELITQPRNLHLCLGELRSREEGVSLSRGSYISLFYSRSFVFLCLSSSFFPDATELGAPPLSFPCHSVFTYTCHEMSLSVYLFPPIG